MKLYAEITRYEVIKKELCGQDTKIHRELSSYVQPINKIMDAIDREFGSLADVQKGQKLTIEIVEMSDEDIKNFPNLED